MPSRRFQKKSLVSTLLCAGSLASASLVYVSSYANTVTTLSYAKSHGYGHGITKLEAVAVSKQCSDNPSWLTLDHPDALLYCIDEGLNTPDGALTSFRTNPDGSLKQLDQSSTPNGPVAGVVFGSRRHGLALAHYGAGSLTTWDVSNPKSLKLLETKQYNLTGPPADPSRQNGPHPHQAVLDPTGKYILIPDLGLDVIHLYGFDEHTLKLRDLTPKSVRPGSGPRHIAFVQKLGKTFAYLTTELGNTIVGYEVTYPRGCIELKQIFEIPSHGEGTVSAPNTFISEVVISPDGNNVLISSRGDNDFQIPSFDNPKVNITSDPIINFKINPRTGALTAIQTVPAGGRYPRQFSINKAGDTLVIGSQFDARVAFLERDVKTGLLGNFVAYANIAGNITSAFFDE